MGSRNWKDLLRIKNYIDTLDETVVISGGAIGVDRMAEQLAKMRGLETKIFPEKLIGKEVWAFGGMRRNNDIVNETDCVVVARDSESKEPTIRSVFQPKAGKPLLIFLPKCWL